MKTETESFDDAMTDLGFNPDVVNMTCDKCGFVLAFIGSANESMTDLADLLTTMPPRSCPRCGESEWSVPEVAS